MTKNEFQSQVLDFIPVVQQMITEYFSDILAPVLYFGNLKDAELLTVSLNPSEKEFISDKGRYLESDSEIRFESLHSLNKPNWKHISEEQYASIIGKCDNYFKNNPYRKWFDPLNKILIDNGYSYYEEKGYKTAAHVDICCLPTIPKWGLLPDNIKQLCLSIGIPVLLKLLSASESPCLEKLVLNGRSAVELFNSITSNSIQETSKQYVKLDKRRTTCYEGSVASICYNGHTYRLNKTVKIVGWSAYSQRPNGNIEPGNDKFDK